MMAIETVLLLVGALSALYFWATSNYGWFRSRGIPEVPAYFPLGSTNTWKGFMGKVAFQFQSDEAAKFFPDEPLVGYMGPKPTLVINDTELAKMVLIKDFDHFIDRRNFDFNQNTVAEKLFANMLTTLQGDKWRRMRNIISPVFSGGKLRKMTPLLNKVGSDLVTHLTKLAEKEEECNGKDVMVNYTLDTISTCGLGVESNSLNDPDSSFKQMVDKFRKVKPLQVLKSLIFMASPELSKKLFATPFIDQDFAHFFLDVVRKSMQHRKETGVRRNDFIDLLESLKSAGDAEGASNDEKGNNEEQEESRQESIEKMSQEDLEILLVSNVMLLFFAGFDTTSSVLNTCLWCLAKHPDKQESLAQEIRDAISEHGSSHLEYSTIQELPYLDMFLHEATRIFPITHLERECVRDYRVPGTNLVVPAGMIVQVAARTLMEAHYPNPGEFNPENFSAENKASRNPFVYMAFGQGPRSCVAMRLALLMMKVALVHLVANFTVINGAKNPERLEVDPRSMQGLPKGGVWVKFEKREKQE